LLAETTLDLHGSIYLFSLFAGTTIELIPDVSPLAVCAVQGERKKPLHTTTLDMWQQGRSSDEKSALCLTKKGVQIKRH